MLKVIYVFTKQDNGSLIKLIKNVWRFIIKKKYILTKEIHPIYFSV